MDTTKLAIKFTTSGKQITHVHVAGCPGLNRGKGIVITEDVTENIADLTDRGYKVVHCKCTKAQ